LDIYGRSCPGNFRPEELENSAQGFILIFVRIQEERRMFGKHPFLPPAMTIWENDRCTDSLDRLSADPLESLLRILIEILHFRIKFWRQELKGNLKMITEIAETLVSRLWKCAGFE
jgi:hypothetical protein